MPQKGGKTDWNDAYKAGDLTGDGAEKFLDLCLFEGDLLLSESPREKAPRAALPAVVFTDLNAKIAAAKGAGVAA